MKISLITATFNSRECLKALIQSVRAQNASNFEWIVVDGGSTDGTQDAINEASDVVTRWKSEPDFGVYHAINKALRMATGEYYLVVGSDDLLEPGAIQRYCENAIATGADIISAPIWVDGKLLTIHQRSAWMRSGPPRISGHSVGALIRVKLHDELGYYSRRFPIAADTFFMLKVEAAGKKFEYIDHPAGTFGTGGMSSGDTLGALMESTRATIAVRGHWIRYLLLLALRIVKNSAKISRQSRGHANTR